MTASTLTATPVVVRGEYPRATGTRTAFTTLTRRRLALSARTPRELLVPLMTPVLFALVIAPALASIGPTIPRRDLLAAPVKRPLIVLANLAVALMTTALQVVVLIIAAVLRGADLSTSTSGIVWFVAAAMLLGIAMYSVAETISNRIPSVEDYTG